MINGTLFKQLFRFGLVGVGAAASHFCIALAITQIGNLNIQLANLIGFWTGFLFSYLGQAIFTFNKRPSLGNFFYYIGLGGINYVISSGIVFIGSKWLPAWAVFATVVTLIPIFSFLVGKHFIFKQN